MQSCIWYLALERDSQLWPTLVPFVPEVHEELTKLWKAPFTARALFTSSSTLTTPDGGVARGYTEVPQVEQSIAVHLCIYAATWQNRPRLPSRACSLAVSVTDMTAPVVGSSGGVYALVSAHLANVVMNWSGMKCQFKLFRMAMALVCMSVEFGRAVWLRFYPPAFPPCPNPSFVAHLGGVAVGLTLGVVVLQNYEQRLQEQSLFWIFFSVYTIFILCGIFWNIFAYNLLDVKLPPPP
ncbi:hypothetical protein PO909_005810 [Leuciscus waleckii]